LEKDKQTGHVGMDLKQVDNCRMIDVNSIIEVIVVLHYDESNYYQNSKE